MASSWWLRSGKWKSVDCSHTAAKSAQSSQTSNFEKMKRLPSHHLHSKFEAPTKNRLKRQSPNRLVKALQQKCWIPSWAYNEPLEMLLNYEDWQAETPTIMLDIPGIQAKEHHADEELKSLTLKADPSGSLWLQGSSQQTTGLKPTPCSQQPRPWTRKRDFLPTQCFWLTAGPSCRFFNHQEGTSNIRQELSQLKNKTSVTLQWIPSHCGVGENEEADRLSKMGSKLEQSAHPMSYSKAKAIPRHNFRTEWWQRLDIGTEEDSIHQLGRAAQVTIFKGELDTVNSSPTSTHWKFHIQMNVHAAQVLKPPTTSCSPAPPPMLWDARHGPVQWMPTGSIGYRLKHCSRLRTLPYSLDRRSSMARNAEEEEKSNFSDWKF